MESPRWCATRGSAPSDSDSPATRRAAVIRPYQPVLLALETDKLRLSPRDPPSGQDRSLPLGADRLLLALLLRAVVDAVARRHDPAAGVAEPVLVDVGDRQRIGVRRGLDRARR